MTFLCSTTIQILVCLLIPTNWINYRYFHHHRCSTRATHTASIATKADGYTTTTNCTCQPQFSGNITLQHNIIQEEKDVTHFAQNWGESNENYMAKVHVYARKEKETRVFHAFWLWSRLKTFYQESVVVSGWNHSLTHRFWTRFSEKGFEVASSQQFEDDESRMFIEADSNEPEQHWEKILQ